MCGIPFEAWRVMKKQQVILVAKAGFAVVLLISSRHQETPKVAKSGDDSVTPRKKAWARQSGFDWTRKYRTGQAKGEPSQAEQKACKATPSRARARVPSVSLLAVSVSGRGGGAWAARVVGRGWRDKQAFGDCGALFSRHALCGEPDAEKGPWMSGFLGDDDVPAA
jgi:hypothetical protein